MFNKPLSGRRSPKRYVGMTKADEVFYQLKSQGMETKEAAKQAQNTTGLSLLTGKRMTTRGFGVQNYG